MYLIIGLGNPGEEYKDTRHNIGFRVVDSLSSKLKDQISNQIQNPSFDLNNPLQAALLEGQIEDKRVVLAKPITFMNNSGLAVKKILNTKYQILYTNLIVVHDDIALELGQVKISKGAGSGKHNGVQSIIDHLKTNDFVRVRCGIGRGDGVLTDVVLSKFKPDEKETVDKMMQEAAGVCIKIVTDGPEKAMNTFN